MVRKQFVIALAMLVAMSGMTWFETASVATTARKQSPVAAAHVCSLGGMRISINRGGDLVRQALGHSTWQGLFIGKSGSDAAQSLSVIASVVADRSASPWRTLYSLRAKLQI